MQAAARHSQLPGLFLVTEIRRWLLRIHDSLVDVLDNSSAEEEGDRGRSDKEPAGLEEGPQAHQCEGTSYSLREHACSGFCPTVLQILPSPTATAPQCDAVRAEGARRRYEPGHHPSQHGERRSRRATASCCPSTLSAQPGHGKLARGACSSSSIGWAEAGCGEHGDSHTFLDVGRQLHRDVAALCCREPCGRCEVLRSSWTTLPSAACARW